MLIKSNRTALQTFKVDEQTLERPVLLTIIDL